MLSERTTAPTSAGLSCTLVSQGRSSHSARNACPCVRLSAAGRATKRQNWREVRSSSASLSDFETATTNTTGLPCRSSAIAPTRDCRNIAAALLSCTGSCANSASWSSGACTSIQSPACKCSSVGVSGRISERQISNVDTTSWAGISTYDICAARAVSERNSQASSPSSCSNTTPWPTRLQIENLVSRSLAQPSASSGCSTLLRARAS